MNDELETLFKQARQERLTAEEREVLRSRLVSFMRLHPVRNSGSERQLHQQSILQTLIVFLRKPMPLVAVYLVIALALGGGVSLAAEQSVPGEVLYPVKVSVNEEVRGTLTLSSKGKAEWETRKLERRLEEAQELNASGKLNPEVRAALAEKIEVHVEHAETNAREAEGDAESQFAADINARVEAAFQTHIEVLNALLLQADESNAKVKVEMEGFKLELERKKDDAEGRRAEIESKVRVQTDEAMKKSAENSKKSVERKLDEVKKFLEKQEERLGAEATARAKTRLELAQKTYADAKVKFDAKVYAESFSLFRTAHQQAQEAKLLTDLSKNLNIDLDVRFDDDDDENATSTPEFEGRIRSNKEIKVNVNGVELKGKGTFKINGEDIKIEADESKGNQDDDEDGDATEIEINIKGNGTGTSIRSNSSIFGTGTVIQNSQTSIKSNSKVEYRSE